MDRVPYQGGTMMAACTKANALPPQGIGESKNDSNAASFADSLASIKETLLAGRDVRLIDYTPEQRPVVVGAIAMLRDELPIRTGWQTIRESHLSETRLRARRYSIPGEFLREVGHD